MLNIFISACSSTPEIAAKGVDLNSLEAQANYITSKNACKQIQAANIHLTDKAFLLGAFDVRDGITARVPENSYNTLVETLHTNSSPLANVAKINSDDESNFPNGLRTLEERLSYLTAFSIAKSFGKKGIPVLPTSMAVGLADTQTKDAQKFTPEEEKIIINKIKEKIQLTDNDWAENRKHYYMAEEKAFFADNIIKPNVMSLASGVQYIVLKKGSGKTPKPNDTVTVNYRGLLLDGTEFDSNYNRNGSDTFKLNAMIAGFTQGVSQIQEGSKVLIYIPATLAYGDKGTVGIPPYAAVMFEVDLLSIKTGFFH